MAASWICTHCGAANGIEIHRCQTCLEWRKAEAPEVSGPPTVEELLLPEDEGRLREIRSAGPLRAAWLYLMWSRLPRPYRWIQTIVFVVMLAVAVLAQASEGLSAGWWGTVTGVLIGLTLSAFAAKRYRSDRSFRLAIVALGAVQLAIYSGLVAVVAAAWAVAGGETLWERVMQVVAPSSDPVFAFVAIVGSLFAALVLAGVLGQRAYRRDLRRLTAGVAS